MAKKNVSGGKRRGQLVRTVGVFTDASKVCNAVVEQIGAVAMRSFWIAAVAGIMVLVANVLAK